MAEDQAPLPEVKSGVTPYLNLENVAAAIEFYKTAFAAEAAAVRVAGPDDPRIMHAHLYINGGSVMLSDCFPEHGHPFVPLQGFNLYLDVDAPKMWWDRAVAAGASVVVPLQIMFWGDWWGLLQDPHGVHWTIGARANKDG